MLCSTAEDLFAFARSFAGKLAKDDLVLLYGSLGAGKTLFVKGLCSGLGIDADAVSSPTFTLMHTYGGRGNLISHFDLYRLSDVEEFFLIGGEEVLGRQICLIEWPQLIEEILPARYISVRIDILTDSSRQVHIVRRPGGEVIS